MRTKQALWITALSGVLLAAGCTPTAGDSYYGYPSYRTYDPYYGRPYYGGTYGSYYDPYYNPRRSHRQLHRGLERGAGQVEQKYDKGMRRLDRQEHEAREKAYRKYGSNTSDPRYQEQLDKIDRRYDHKRDKVDHLRNKGYRELERKHDTYHRGW